MNIYFSSCIPVRTGMYHIHTCLLKPVQHYSHFWKVHLCTYLLRVHILSSCSGSIVRLPGPCQLFRHHPSHSTKSHQSTGRFTHDCLAAPLPVPARLGVSFTRLTNTMSSCLLTSSTSPLASQQRSARCKWACEGLGLHVGALMMTCKNSSNPAKLKDLIREI
jgi:hypothetical protein